MGKNNNLNKIAVDLLEIFEAARLDELEEFEKEWLCIEVPWYLKPFTKKIKEMHFTSFRHRKI